MFANFFSGLSEFHFLQNALITSVVIGVIAGTIGSFIILRGMSLMGDAISHAVLPGVAISFMLGVHPLIGAAVFGVVASFLITLIGQNSVIKSDTAIGITFSTFLALGVILIALVPTTTNLFHILFGNVLAVQDQDMYLTIGISIVVFLTIIMFFKELLLTSFDPTMAKALGIRVNFYHYLLMTLLTLVAVVSMQSVGTILIVSLLITPAATAYLFVNQLKTMMIVSACLGGLTSFLGLFLGYNLNIAVGSCIVIVGAIIFVISFIFSPKQTLIHRRRLTNESKINS
ncbi:membrane protein [Lentilactobacillus fungorum]|jgi:ABC-type Mn2+/Zn2+ transport system permease subunit|uniref:Membrane protein n=1 Tax=Lentilactobacillus fungorum TaxID=2201250 RepID=A0ABQ3W253_9LACO|nr:metal ABC transporter permease [Lentilactobacillus fungorum]GHP14910.1 membrane protein [Lentilactobacillus fungorum]